MSKKKLYLEGYVHDPDMEKDKFIFMFLREYNKKFRTYHKKTGSIQCAKGRHRSLKNIWRIVKNYYPGTKIEEVRAILLSFGEQLVGHYCYDIRRRVYELAYNYSSWDQCPRNWRESSRKDEFGVPITYLQTPCPFDKDGNRIDS